ncbi:hypothetical protein V502_00265 [Pseudogymnoascus sp. VKM F-4520 (FW-2644)]|nr:hypothetical protein V502_00265 [Pseudogymnoascus sp. VKM F-4520 (FW-2644)]
MPLIYGEGREKALRQLREEMDKAMKAGEMHTKLSGDGPRRTVVVHGLGGMGKTQLSVAYAKRHKNSYSAVFWMNIKDEDSLKQSFARIARQILREHPSPSRLSKVDTNENLDEVVDAVKAWLSLPNNTRWLMIYDNYDKPKLSGNIDHAAIDIRRFLPESYQGSIITTTRSSQVKIGHLIRIRKLENVRDSLKILSNVSRQERLIDDPGVKQAILAPEAGEPALSREYSIIVINAADVIPRTITDGRYFIIARKAVITRTVLDTVTMQRHAAIQHGRRRGEQPLWEACELQTIFCETKDRRYFRVASSHVGMTGDGEQTYKHDGIQYAQTWVKKVDQIKNGTKNISSRSTSLMSNPIPQRVVSVAVSSRQLRTLQPSQSITFRHPFTHIAAKYVHLSVHRLDNLFKSDAFRFASNPVFDGSHVDAALNMRAVFPQSEEEPVFFNALLYSTVQIVNRGTLTVEGHSLQKRIIELLNEKLTAPLQSLSPATVGAVMILKATAYRSRDIVAHNTHSQGLTKMLEVINRTENSLTPAAQRAIFWLDLNAAVLIDSKRQMSHLDLPQTVNWQRGRCPDLAHSLPIGFIRHRDTLPYGLLECISDIVELQVLLRIGTIARSPHYAKFHQLDAMQASIESRLAFQAHACMQLGVVTEAVRLGVFMCCYCSWMETWNDSLIPCRLAEKLLDILEPTAWLSSPQFTRIWLQHIDILLWLLLVVSSVAELDQGRMEGLKSRQSRLVILASSSSMDVFSSCSEVDLKDALKNALQDFIYKDEWLPKRHYIKEWFELELSISC